MSKIRSIFLFLILTIALPIFAEYNRMGVPDSSSIRESVAESWFYPSVKNLRGKEPEVYTNSIGQKFQVRFEESDNDFSVIVAPEVSLSFSVTSKDGNSTEIVSDFPANACGAWILTRDSLTGKPKQIRYYFVQDGEVYVQFSPDAYTGRKTLADYVIGGCYASRAVPVGLSFKRLYTASFGDVLSLTERILPWYYADIHPGQYENKNYMINKIRKSLSKVKFASNSAYDKDGNPVYSLNGEPRAVFNDDVNYILVDSNGFTKWIIDGLVYPITGSGIVNKTLFRKTVFVNPLGYAGVRGENENLNFSLDWTRNLAAARLSTQTKKMYMYEESGVDVNIEPFSATVTSNGIANLSGYLKNTGYNAKYLNQILYVLGVTEPTYFYLAAIRKSIPSNLDNKQTEIFAFEDSAVIFPYFDKEGRFSCVVFEEGQELTLGAFLAKHGECYVHLSRVLSSDRFMLQ